ncbi:hypothetical protein [Kineococcus aurantiacus]|uniref:Uncharacterized protein n=1 Tax=Kineococcus aurantiacus TaxID=37633 RepID=A0A7Y9DNP1_9ACTN|nr:hypothetical protein [Kineococcus aurantiacus]NYD23944.1 hypothetical protein [Kineococcus aurantiacus]
MIAQFPLATPSPTTSSTATSTSTAGTTTPDVDADLVTPGLRGFVVLFVLAVAVYFLGRSMARRIQRVRHSEQPGADAGPEAEPEEGTGAPGPDAQDPARGPQG